MDYEKLKTYPSREITILTETMNSINKKKSQAMASVKNNSGNMNYENIGEFSS